MMGLLREPLLYFLVAGAAFFLVADLMNVDASERIVVSEAERARLSDQWWAQMGRAPKPEELDSLVERWVREEILYREAVAMGLDEDDTIIRRRLAQKLTFLTEDLGAGQAPSPAALRAFYEAHPDRYTDPARYTFAHRYFSTDLRPDARAAALAELDDPEPVGDPLMLRSEYADRSQREISRLFGEEFASALVALPPGAWQGPVRSAYGWHLVKVERQHPETLRSFDEVAARVAADLKQQRRQEANESYYETLRSRYEVVGS